MTNLHEASNMPDVVRAEPGSPLMKGDTRDKGGPPNINLTDPCETNPIARTENTDAAQYGGQVSPNPPRQNMFQMDILTDGPVHDRTDTPAAFTGGDDGTGLGGMANPQTATGEMGGTVHNDTGI